jgi:hypothetical protein
VLVDGTAPLPLRSQELVTKTVFIQHTPSAPASPAGKLSAYAAMLEAQKKDMASPVPPMTLLSTGRVEVTWRILQSHILRRPHIPLTPAALESPIKGSPRANAGAGGAEGGVLSNDPSTAEWDWLHTLGRDRDGQTEVVDEIRYLNTTFSATPVAKLVYPVPEIKVRFLCLEIFEKICI